LQEAVDADLLLHVVDASNPEFVEQIAQVQSVLKEIGAADIPQLLVFNKLDALEPERRPVRMSDEFEIDGIQTPRVFVSARSAEGLPLLRQRLSSIVSASGESTPDPADSPENNGAGQ
jgi:GTP-binding protein HflX